MAVSCAATDGPILRPTRSPDSSLPFGAAPSVAGSPCTLGNTPWPPLRPDEEPYDEEADRRSRHRLRAPLWWAVSLGALGVWPRRRPGRAGAPVGEGARPAGDDRQHQGL